MNTSTPPLHIGDQVWVNPAYTPGSHWETAVLLAQSSPQEWRVRYTADAQVALLPTAALYPREALPQVVALLLQTAVEAAIAWCRQGYVGDGLETPVYDYAYMAYVQLQGEELEGRTLTAATETVYREAALHLLPEQQSRLRCRLKAMAFSANRPRFSFLAL